MAAPAACSAPPRHLRRSTALLSPSAAAPAPSRRIVGYGYGSSSTRRWAHAASRIRRPTPRSKTARVSCAYKTGGKGRLAVVIPVKLRFLLPLTARVPFPFYYATPSFVGMVDCSLLKEVR
jgi:hypothetical protein